MQDDWMDDSLKTDDKAGNTDFAVFLSHLGSNIIAFTKDINFYGNLYSPSCGSKK